MIMRQSCRRISAAAHAGIVPGCMLTIGTGGSSRDGHASRAVAVALEHRRLVQAAGEAVGCEARARRAQHEPADEVAVPAPHELRDRSAHRIAHRDHRPGSERFDRRGAVVGAIGEAEDTSGTQSARVAAQVGCDDVEVLAQRFERPEPVEAGARDPPVEQEQRRGAGWARDLAHERRATVGECDAPTEGQRRTVGRRVRPGHRRGHGATRSAQNASTR